MAIRQCYYCMKALDTNLDDCPSCGHYNSYVAMEQAKYALPCGTLLHDRYIMGRVLGKGGFGITYIGFDSVLQTRVCIKEYYPTGAAYRDATRTMRVHWNPDSPAELTVSGRDHFMNEARKAAKLRNFQSVVKVWDVFSENETSYIVMDYIEGVTLKQFTQSLGRTLEPYEVVQLFTPVLNDLDAIHQLGIIHRDISPDNLMVQPNGELTLLDLGAAKDLRNDTGDATMHVARRGYSPPEQYLYYTQIRPSTDVYAMCATIYYCLCGKPTANPMERSSGVALDLSMLPPKLAAVLERGLDLQPENRFQTMSMLRDALVNAVPKRKASDKSDVSNLLIVAIAAVVVLSIGGIVALLLL